MLSNLPKILDLLTSLLIVLICGLLIFQVIYFQEESKQFLETIEFTDNCTVVDVQRYVSEGITEEKVTSIAEICGNPANITSVVDVSYWDTSFTENQVVRCYYSRDSCQFLGIIEPLLGQSDLFIEHVITLSGVCLLLVLLLLIILSRLVFYIISKSSGKNRVSQYSNGDDLNL